MSAGKLGASSESGCDARAVEEPILIEKITSKPARSNSNVVEGQTIQRG